MRLSVIGGFIMKNWPNKAKFIFCRNNTQNKSKQAGLPIYIIKNYHVRT